MKNEKFEILENHSLIVTTNDRFDKEKGQYEVLPNTIKKIILYLSERFELFDYYQDHFKNKDKVNYFIVLKKLISKDIIVFEPLDNSFFEEEYVLERFIIGSENIQPILQVIKSKDFSSKAELEEFLQKKLKIDVLCKIYDSSYIEINSKNSLIIKQIKEIICN